MPEPTWATEAEIQEQWYSETFSQEEQYYYEMQQAEIYAEEGWLRAAENAGWADSLEEERYFGV